MQLSIILYICFHFIRIQKPWPCPILRSPATRNSHNSCCRHSSIRHFRGNDFTLSAQTVLASLCLSRVFECVFACRRLDFTYRALVKNKRLSSCGRRHSHSVLRFVRILSGSTVKSSTNSVHHFYIHNIHGFIYGLGCINS